MRDAVLDTLQAYPAEAVGYRSIGIENDDRYCDMARQAIPLLASHQREQADCVSPTDGSSSHAAF